MRTIWIIIPGSVNGWVPGELPEPCTLAGIHRAHVLQFVFSFFPLFPFLFFPFFSSRCCFLSATASHRFTAGRSNSIRKGIPWISTFFFCTTEEHGIVARFVVNDYAAFWCDRTILRMNITFDIVQMLVWRIWKLATSSWKLVCTEILVCAF